MVILAGMLVFGGFGGNSSSDRDKERPPSVSIPIEDYVPPENPTPPPSSGGGGFSISIPSDDEVQVREFKRLLEEGVRIEIGQPIEGYEPQMFMQVFPELLEEDFDEVPLDLVTRLLMRRRYLQITIFCLNALYIHLILNVNIQHLAISTNNASISLSAISHKFRARI